MARNGPEAVALLSRAEAPSTVGDRSGDHPKSLPSRFCTERIPPTEMRKFNILCGSKYQCPSTRARAGQRRTVHRNTGWMRPSGCGRGGRVPAPFCINGGSERLAHRLSAPATASVFGRASSETTEAPVNRKKGVQRRGPTGDNRMNPSSHVDANYHVRRDDPRRTARPWRSERLR